MNRKYVIFDSPLKVGGVPGFSLMAVGYVNAKTQKGALKTAASKLNKATTEITAIAYSEVLCESKELANEKGEIQ